MSSARELFLQATGHAIPRIGDKEALRLFTQAAGKWRDSGQYLNAGYAMSQAIYAAWGNGERVNACLNAALLDFRNCVSTEPAQSHEGLAAICEWIHQHRYIDDRTYARRTVYSLQEEIVHRLVAFFSDSPNADSYLVKGVILSRDLEGAWEPSYPENEVELSTVAVSSGRISTNLPPAFKLFIALSDFEGAERVIQRCPDSFHSPGLRGWRAAVRGFLQPKDAVRMFTEAADAFAEDVIPSEEDLAKRGGSWSGINQQLWSKYFRARAAIANIRLDRLHVQDLIRTASAILEGTESGFVHPQVSRFRVLVRALAGLIGQEPGVSAERARALLLQESRWSGEEKDDVLSLQFLTASAEALDEFKRDPAMAITKGRLTTALDALRRIPLLGSDVAEAVEPVIGARAVSEILGPVRTWIYRTLERLDGEDKLRKIILRLAQASLPLYAHIRHGPIEYGKDIVVFFERDGRRVLRMYQAKCGDVTIPTWREARDQLEEIFLVPLPNVQIRDQIDQRQGILVCNGHANPQVEPIMLGWFQEQKRVHNRDFEFMHLDALVNWIIDDRLVNEFKVALSELGIKVVAGDDL